MRNALNYIFTRVYSEEDQEINKHIISSCLTTSRIAIFIIEFFEMAFFLTSMVRPELFGRQVEHYRFCYMFLFVFCFVVGVMLMTIQQDFENRHKWVRVLGPVAALVLVGWSLAVTYLDSVNYTVVNPTLFMTMILCIPGCIYITPLNFLFIDIVSTICMYLILHSNAMRNPGVAAETFSHFTVFCLIETIVGLSFLYIRFNYYKNTKESVSATQEQVKAQESLVQATRALALAIDAKDQYTQGHSSRVADYSQMLADKMGLGREMQKKVYFMALMHDVGKIGVPDSLINKPTRLTDEEYEQVKQHTVKGYEILKTITSIPELACGARWHHEKYDGSGYPDHLAGEDIPLEARIIAVADAYDTMSSVRSYRGIYTQDRIREELEKGRGKQFDPFVANCMLELIDEDPDYKMHELNKECPK